MSDSKIPAGLSIWQVKALQEIDRLEEEKDEVLAVREAIAAAHQAEQDFWKAQLLRAVVAFVHGACTRMRKYATVGLGLAQPCHHQPATSPTRSTTRTS